MNRYFLSILTQMKPNYEKTTCELSLCFSCFIIELVKMTLKYSFCILDEIFHCSFTRILIVR